MGGGEDLTTYATLAQFEDDINKVAVLEKALKADNVLVVEAAMNRYFLGHLVFLMRLR